MALKISRIKLSRIFGIYLKEAKIKKIFLFQKNVIKVKSKYNCNLQLYILKFILIIIIRSIKHSSFELTITLLIK